MERAVSFLTSGDTASNLVMECHFALVETAWGLALGSMGIPCFFSCIITMRSNIYIWLECSEKHYSSDGWECLWETIDTSVTIQICNRERLQMILLTDLYRWFCYRSSVTDDSVSLTWKQITFQKHCCANNGWFLFARVGNVSYPTFCSESL